MELYKEIHLPKAGVLSTQLSQHEKDYITHLKISGYLNSDDFNVLGDMCDSYGRYNDDDIYIIDEEEPPFLKILDLGECNLVGLSGFPEFTYHSKLEKIIFPKNLKNTSPSFISVFEDSIYLKEVTCNSKLKEIGDGTFISCERLEEISLPESLTTICNFAFSGTGLRTITIPANVSLIVGNPFPYCDNLKEIKADKENKHFLSINGILYSKDKTKLITFPAGHSAEKFIVPKTVKIIGSHAFAGSKLKEIILPDTIELIERSAFSSCENITGIHIPDSVKEIGELAFRFCFKLSEVRLSNQITILKKQTFSSCSSLKELEVPSSVKIIEETALCWTENLEKLILNEGLEEIQDDFRYTKIKTLFIPKTVRKVKSGLAIIGENPLRKIKFKVDKDNPYLSAESGSNYNKDKTRLISAFSTNEKEFTIPKGVRIIEQFVFESTDFEHIFLPNTIQTIKYRCFENAKNLKEITLPQSLKRLDFRAFDGCENLETMFVLSKTPPKLTGTYSDAWKFMSYSKKITLFVPEVSIELYKNTTGWSDIKRIKPILDELI